MEIQKSAAEIRKRSTESACVSLPASSSSLLTIYSEKYCKNDTIYSKNDEMDLILWSLVHLPKTKYSVKIDLANI